MKPNNVLIKQEGYICRESNKECLYGVNPYCKECIEGWIEGPYASLDYSEIEEGGEEE